MTKKFFLILLLGLFFGGCAIMKPSPMDLAEFSAASLKISELKEHSGAPASDDLAIIVNISNPDMAISGTNEKITVANFLSSLNGENIQDATIDDDSINFSDVTLNDFTDDVGFANEGANTDITSLTGLTTALGPAYGGTGSANDASSTWTISGNYATTVTITGITSITLPTSGTLLASNGVGTNLTALNGENIQDDTIDDDSLDFSDITLDDLTFDVEDVDKSEFGRLDGLTEDIQTSLDSKLSASGSASGLSGYSLGAQPVDEQLTDFADGTDSQVKEAKHSAPSIDYGEEVWADLDWDPLGRNVTTGSISTLTFHENGASADTITRSSGSFITDGFEDDMRIYVDTGNNAGFYTLNAVTDATTLTLISTDDLIDESTPSNVTIDGGWRYLVQETQAGWVGQKDENGKTLTSSINISSGTLIIPNGTDPSTATVGSIGVDTDDNFIEFHGNASGRIVEALKCETYPVARPAELDDDIVLKHFMADAYPHGVTIKDIALSASASASDTHVIEEWSDRAGTSQSTVESITLSSSQYQEDDGTLSDSAIAADSFLVLNKDDSTDSIAELEVTVTFYINAGD